MNWKLKLVLWYSSLTKTPDYDAIDISELRRNSNASARLGSMLFDRKVPVSVVQDVNADGVPLRIYRNNISQDQRVMIYYHGGGFVLYGLDSHDKVCRRLCAMNDCIVVSVDYRLAPEYQYPAAHEDAYQAIKWIKKNIVRYGGNSQNMLVAGDSAGAAIAASMAHRCHRDGIRLRAQILIYPWIDGRLTNPSLDRNGEGYMLTKKAIVWFQKQYTPRAEDHCLPDVSPCYESDFTDLPPAFILTAELDPLIDDGYRYFHQLKAGGTPCHYHEYKGLIHGFINIPMIAPEAMSAFDDIKKFLAGIG